jgi:hypothetical protein
MDEARVRPGILNHSLRQGLAAQAEMLIRADGGRSQCFAFGAWLRIQAPRNKGQ